MRDAISEAHRGLVFATHEHVEALGRNLTRLMAEEARESRKLVQELFVDLVGEIEALGDHVEVCHAVDDVRAIRRVVYDRGRVLLHLMREAIRPIQCSSVLIRAHQ